MTTRSSLQEALDLRARYTTGEWYARLDAENRANQSGFTVEPTALFHSLRPDSLLSDNSNFTPIGSLAGDIATNPFLRFGKDSQDLSYGQASDAMGHLNYLCRARGTTAAGLAQAVDGVIQESENRTGPSIRAVWRHRLRQTQSEAMQSMLGPEPTIGVGMTSNTEDGRVAVFVNDSSPLTCSDRTSLNPIAVGALFNCCGSAMSRRVKEAVMATPAQTVSGSHEFVNLTWEEVQELRKGRIAKEMSLRNCCTEDLASEYGIKPSPRPRGR